MRNQMKFYLIIIALTLLSSSIFSSKLVKAAKNMMKVKSQVQTQTKHLCHDFGDHRPEDCVAFDEQNVLNNNNPAEVPNPQNTSGCRDPSQVDDHVWTQLPASTCLKFNDLGVNSEGGIVAIGADGKLYFYNYDLDTFEEVKGDFLLYGLRRVDFGYDGLIYVVNMAGDTYFLSCNRYWVKLPGCAIDIGTGRGDEVAKIGCDDYCETLETAVCSTHIDKKSHHVYKLHCDCDCRCCRKRCNIFVKHVFTCDKEHEVDRKCYWIKYPYGPTYDDAGTKKLCNFTRIDVNSSGHPVVVAQCGSGVGSSRLYQFVGANLNVWRLIFTTTDSNKIKDVCGDNLGNIFYIYNSSVYIYNSSNGDYAISLLNTAGNNIVPGENISCGPYAQPTVTDANCCMWTTTKVGYN